MKKLLLIALSTLAMGAQAAEKNKFHVGGGLSAWTMKADASNTSGQFNITAIEGVASYDLLPWLTLDGRLGVGMDRELESFTTYGNLTRTTIEKPASGTTAAATVDGVLVTNTYMPIKAELNYYASFFLKPQIKNDTAAFYGLVGVTLLDTSYSVEQAQDQTVRYTGSLSDLNALKIYDVSAFTNNAALFPQETTESEAYLSLGVGVSFFFDRWTLNTEWKSVLNSDKVGNTGLAFKTSNITANVTYGF